MLSIEKIKKRIAELYKKNPNIHVNINMTSPRTNLSDYPVVITGVYPYIFQIEETYSGIPKRHFIQYNDVLANHFQIIEL